MFIFVLSLEYLIKAKTLELKPDSNRVLTQIFAPYIRLDKNFVFIVFLSIVQDFHIFAPICFFFQIK